MGARDERTPPAICLTAWEIAHGEGAPLRLILSFEDALGEKGQFSIELPLEAAGPLGRTLSEVGKRADP